MAADGHELMSPPTAEPYVTRFETKVTAVDGHRVRLERSYFHPESGGQPADRGTIGGVSVTDVTLEDGEAVHHLADSPRLSVGRRVLCSIDRPFRLYCMRAHTAGHLLYGAAKRTLADVTYEAFDIDEQRVRVDLETTSNVDDETILELNELLVRTVWEARPVSWESIPIDAAHNRADVTFDGTTTREAADPDYVGVVTIGATTNGRQADPRRDGTDEPWDVTACNGTHVRNTREVGPVTVLEWSRSRSGTVRIELAVGERAIERRTLEKRIAVDLKRALGNDIDRVSDDIGRLVDGERSDPVVTDLE